MLHKPYRIFSLAFLLALLSLGLFAAGISAEDLSPPYMIVLHPWSEDATVVDVDPTLGYAYVIANKGVAVFRELTRTDTIDIGAPRRIGVDPVRGYAYVTRNVEWITVLSATQTISPYILNTVNVGAGSEAIAVLTTTGYAYITLPGDNDTGDDYVAVLNGGVKVGDNIRVGDRPFDVAANPVTGYVYVSNLRSDTVSVIQGTRVVATLSKFLSQPGEITVNPVTGYVYVCNGDGTLTIFQGTTFVDQVNFAQTDDIDPVEVAVNKKTGHVYVALNNRDIDNPMGWLDIMSGTTRLDHTIAMQADVRAVAINENSGYVYVSSGSDAAGTVTILSDTIKLESFPMGQTAPYIAIDPVVDLAYVPIKDGRVAIFGRTPIYVSPPLYDTLVQDVTFTCLNIQMGQYLPITITVPAGAIHSGQQTRVLCTPLRDVEATSYQWASQAFRLSVAYEPTGTLPLEYTFAVPLIVTMTYVSPLPGAIVESATEVRYGEWRGDLDRWVWSGDSVHPVSREPSYQRLTVRLDQIGYYALLWQERVYLPLLMR